MGNPLQQMDTFSSENPPFWVETQWNSSSPVAVSMKILGGHHKHMDLRKNMAPTTFEEKDMTFLGIFKKRGPNPIQNPWSFVTWRGFQKWGYSTNYPILFEMFQYPLVNVTAENHHVIAAKISSFHGHFQGRKLLQITRGVYHSHYIWCISTSIYIYIS